MTMMKMIITLPNARNDQAKRLNPYIGLIPKVINPSQLIFRLKVSGLPGIMLHVPRVLHKCFRGMNRRRMGCRRDPNSRKRMDFF